MQQDPFGVIMAGQRGRGASIVSEQAGLEPCVMSSCLMIRGLIHLSAKSGGVSCSNLLDDHRKGVYAVVRSYMKAHKELQP